MRALVRAFGVLSLLSLAQCAPSRTAPAQPRESTDHPAATAEDPCLLFGTGYSFTLGPPPAGFRVLCGDEVPEGHDELALVLPSGDAEAAEAPFMYVTVGPKEGGESLQDFIAAQNRQLAGGFDSSSPLTVAAHGELSVGDGTMAPVWEYAHAPSHRYELMAFAAYGDVVVYIALDAPTHEQLAATERSFAELVRSMHFLSTNVEVKR